jgi:threonine/homoserine/homoserine lactone efflux protein
MEQMLAYAVYVFVMSITPGPNNVMVTASGAAFGYRRTVPHILGVSIGCAVQTITVGLGVGLLFERYPLLYDILRWAGALYLAYLGWRLLASGAAGEASARAKPIRFIEAALFQFLNPKAWMIALAAALFLPRELGPIWGAAAIAVILIVVNYPCISVWALFGVGLRRFLTDAFRLRLFNAILALALAATGVMMVL